ncbi:hypothetical protein [Streptomyces sp. NPDC046182]|uniref:hypothetical protein n=1 Tax=Streptomyces sp. NPDC046182 TaxID=3154601 RepID=UPI0033DB785E
MATDEKWQLTDCAGLEICRDGSGIRGLRLLGWQEVLPRSLAAALDARPAQVECRPARAGSPACTEPARSRM